MLQGSREKECGGRTGGVKEVTDPPPHHPRNQGARIQ